MTTVRLTVTLPEEQVQSAKEAVSTGRARSVSAYIAEALRERQQSGDFQQVLDEYFAEHGPPTAEERAHARHALGY